MNIKREGILTGIITASLCLTCAFSTLPSPSNNNLFAGGSNTINYPNWNGDISSQFDDDSAASLFANNFYSWFVGIFKQNGLELDTKSDIVKQLVANDPALAKEISVSNDQFVITEGDHETTQAANTGYKYGPLTYFFNYFLYNEVTKLDGTLNFQKYKFNQDAHNEQEYQFKDSTLFGKDQSGHPKTVPFNSSNFNGYFGSFIYWIDILPYIEVNQYTTRDTTDNTGFISPEMFYLDSGLYFGDSSDSTYASYPLRLNEQFFLWTQLFTFYYNYGTLLKQASSNSLLNNYFGNNDYFPPSENLDQLWMNNYYSTTFSFDFSSWLTGTSSQSFREFDGTTKCAKKFTGNLASFFPAYVMGFNILSWVKQTSPAQGTTDAITLPKIHYGGSVGNIHYSGKQGGTKGTFYHLGNYKYDDTLFPEQLTVTQAFVSYYTNSGSQGSLVTLIGNTFLVMLPQDKNTITNVKGKTSDVLGGVTDAKFNNYLILIPGVFKMASDVSVLATKYTLSNTSFGGMVSAMYATYDINNKVFDGYVAKAIAKLKQDYINSNRGFTTLSPDEQGKQLAYANYASPGGIDAAFKNVKVLNNWGKIYQDFQAFTSEQTAALNDWVNYIGSLYSQDNLGYQTNHSINDFYIAKGGIHNKAGVDSWLSNEKEFAKEQSNADANGNKDGNYDKQHKISPIAVIMTAITSLAILIIAILVIKRRKAKTKLNNSKDNKNNRK